MGIARAVTVTSITTSLYLDEKTGMSRLAHVHVHLTSPTEVRTRRQLSDSCQDGQRWSEGMSWSINEGPHASHNEKSAASRCGLHESTLCAPHNVQHGQQDRHQDEEWKMKNEVMPSPPNHNLDQLLSR
jgi:hypothetical protein